VRVQVPVLTVSEMNRHEHWRKTWKRAQGQKQTTMFHLLRASRVPPKLPCSVHLTRLYPGELDTDNLQSSCKWVRDTVAKYLGCGDSPRDPITWSYDQVRVKTKKEACVIVEIRDTDAAD
jgi:hypothetical protein